MCAFDRMDLAKEALTLFVRSLPQGSTFSIIGFGTEMKTMCIDGQEYYELNEHSKAFALNKI